MEELLARGRVFARLPAGSAQLQVHAGAQAPYAWLIVAGQAEGMERGLIVADGLLVREVARGVVGRALAVAESWFPADAGCGLRCMMCESCEYGIEIVAMDRLESAEDGFVQLEPGPEWRRLVHGITKERVDEPERTGVVRVAREDAAGERCVQTFERFAGARPQPGQQLQSELGADGGCGLQQHVRFVGQRRDPIPDRVLDAGGEQGGRVVEALPRTAPRCKQLEELAHEERIAAGSPVKGSCQTGRSRPLEGEFDQAYDRLDRDARQRDRAVCLADVAERPVGLRRADRCRRPLCSNHDDAALGALANQVTQQEERRHVGPVKVVE